MRMNKEETAVFSLHQQDGCETGGDLTMDALEAIFTRKSTRKFLDKPMGDAHENRGLS